MSGHHALLFILIAQSVSAPVQDKSQQTPGGNAGVLNNGLASIINPLNLVQNALNTVGNVGNTLVNATTGVLNNIIPQSGGFNLSDCGLLSLPGKALGTTGKILDGISGGINGTLNLDLLKQLDVLGLLGKNGSGLLGLPGLHDILKAGKEMRNLLPGMEEKEPEICKKGDECKLKDNGCMLKKTDGVEIGVCHPCSEKSKYTGEGETVDGCGLDSTAIALLVGLGLLGIFNAILLAIICCQCVSKCPIFKWRMPKNSGPKN